jgi:hypothetical protein
MMTINTTIPQAIQPQILWNHAHVSSDTLDLNSGNNIASTRTVAVHFASQLAQFGSATANTPLGLPAVKLMLLASPCSGTAVRRFIGLIRTKTLIRAKKD